MTREASEHMPKIGYSGRVAGISNPTICPWYCKDDLLRVKEKMLESDNKKLEAENKALRSQGLVLTFHDANLGCC